MTIKRQPGGAASGGKVTEADMTSCPHCQPDMSLCPRCQRLAKQELEVLDVLVKLLMQGSDDERC